MRRDAVSLIQQATAQARRVYAIVNNRSEGNAPLTAQALTAMLAGGTVV